MLEAIRNRAQGWLAKVILALITIPFALWGVDSYFSPNAKTELVAEVGSGGVSREAFAEALKNQAEAMRQAMGENFDLAAIETAGFREKVLNDLVEEEALLQEAKKIGLVVTDAQVAAVLRQIPSFQQDGQFSQARYEQVLQSRGWKPEYFYSLLRRDLLLQAYQQPLAVGALTANATVELVSRIAAQQREISFHDISAAQVAAQVSLSDKAVQTHYEQNKNTYMEPEAVRIEYALLTLDEIAKKISLSEKQVQDYYAANAAKLGAPEERAASHILIEAAAADAVARKQAKAKADNLMAAIRKAPQSFSDVARRESADKGSAAQGGNLGSFTRGRMVKPFEDAVFSMKRGEIRLVESEFGFHIVRLDGIKSDTPALSAVRAQIETELRKQLAQKQFAEASENFGNLVYEQADNLKPAADAYGLTINASDWITRQGQAGGVLGEAKLLTAVFTEDAIKSKQNIETIEIAPNALIAARVLEHRPAKQRPLAEVAGQIREKLLAEEAVKQGEKLGQALIAQLKQGREPAGINWGAFQIVGRQQPGGLGQDAMRKVMRADPAGLPAYTGSALPDGGYRLIRVSRVLDSVQADPMLRMAIENGLQQAYAQTDVAAHVSLAKAAQKVEIQPKALEKKD